MSGTNLKFYPFKRPCPICGEWLDCVTCFHTEKHGMTVEEFLDKYELPGEGRPMAPLTPSTKAVSPSKKLLSTLQENPDTCLTPSYIGRKLNISVQIAQHLLDVLVEKGLLDCEYTKVLISRNWAEPAYRHVPYYTLKTPEIKEEDAQNAVK